MLNFTVEDTPRILDANDVKAIERHGSTLESIIDKTHQLNLEVQELQIESDEDPTDVRKWSETLEAQIGKFEVTLKEVKRVAAVIMLAEQEKREEEKRKQILDEESSWKRLNLMRARNSRKQRRHLRRIQRI